MAREQIQPAGKHGGSKQAGSKQGASKQGTSKQAGQAGSKQASSKGHTPVQVQKFLGGLDYPCTREQILQKARSEGADQNVMRALEQLPERRFESPVSISKEIGNLH
jgi:hypothetical protein